MINNTNLGNTRGGGIYAFHSGGANIAMGDGSVRFISQQIAPRTLAMAITRVAAKFTLLNDPFQKMDTQNDRGMHPAGRFIFSARIRGG